MKPNNRPYLEDADSEALSLAFRFHNLPAPSLVAPAIHRISLNGLNFNYLDWGNAGKTPILFLHGGALNAHTWDIVCLTLREDFHCIALDQRGHGDSDWSDDLDYALETHSADTEAFVEALKLSGFFLVGMSLGGLNALGYAGRHSDMLKGLVLIDVGPDVRVEGARKIANFVQMPSELPSIEDFVERAMEFNPRRDPVVLRRSLIHNLKQLPEGTWTWKYDRRHRIGRNMDEVVERHRELWSAVPNITCPTLVVRGEESDVFLDEDAEKLANTLTDGRWVRIENSGHTVQGDNPRDLLLALRPFLEAAEA